MQTGQEEWAEKVVRDSASKLAEAIGEAASVGKLGRTKDGRGGYVSTYVHLSVRPPEGPLAVWIYFAERGHPYSVSGYVDGVWVGLKRDSHRELEESWAQRLSPEFRRVVHCDDRWDGFRRFFNDVGTDYPPELVSDRVSAWVAGVLREKDLIGNR